MQSYIEEAQKGGKDAALHECIERRSKKGSGLRRCKALTILIEQFTYFKGFEDRVEQLNRRHESVDKKLTKEVQNLSIAGPSHDEYHKYTATFAYSADSEIRKWIEKLQSVGNTDGLATEIHQSSTAMFGDDEEAMEKFGETPMRFQEAVAHKAPTEIYKHLSSIQRKRVKRIFESVVKTPEEPSSVTVPTSASASASASAPASAFASAPGAHSRAHHPA